MASVKSHALGSLRAAKPCFLLNFVVLIPVPLAATRLTAAHRSCSFKNFAFDGPSCKKNQRMKPQAIVKAPAFSSY